MTQEFLIFLWQFEKNLMFFLYKKYSMKDSWSTGEISLYTPAIQED
jgi:hypothetical protein